MAAPNKKVFPLGLNAARLYLLNSSGYLAATSTTVYEGISIGGPTTLTLEMPARENIAHPGNNGVLQYDNLPSLDVTTGSLTVSREDYDTIAAVTGTLVRVSGETNIIGLDTDTEQGSLPLVALVVYRQAKADTGTTRKWETLVFPAVQISVVHSGFQRDREDPVTYNLHFNRTTKDIFGKTYAVADEGYKSATGQKMEGNKRHHFVAWKADGSDVTYDYHADRPADSSSLADSIVYIDGTARTSNLSKSTTGIDLTGAVPTVGQIIINRVPLADTADDVD